MHTKTKDEKEHKRIKYAARLMPTDEEAMSILRERANVLAKLEVQEDKQTHTLVPYVRFQLSKDEWYGIPYQFVKEVIHKNNVTRMLLVPNYISGVINWRGKLITLLDLNVFFKSNITDLTQSKQYVIVILCQNITMGILVNEISGNDTYDIANLEPPLKTNNMLKSEYIIGLHRGVTAIINLDVILKNLNLQLTNMRKNAEQL